ncbi:fused DSP-PTPase phosphatase/NAD kinase-like protein [Clostridium paraputrificum]|uniref:phosphatase domain-containing putative toxin n=1 Tax=Clostridium TaxID=1485 RepID=UPI003D331EAB
MKKSIKFLIILLLCFSITNSFIITTFAKSDSEVYLSLDSKNENILPVNFRKTTELSKLNGTKVNLTGLSDLNISGSSQFTALSFLKLKEDIKTKLPFVDIDLRQESHGFINGNAVSWVGYGNKANIGLSLEEAIQKENAQLSNIPFGKSISLDNGKYNLVPTVVENEEKLITPNNTKYLRLAVTDGNRPTDDIVDMFVNYATTQAKGKWLHFHCKAGEGRTTTFMTLYDMLNNSKNVSLEDIVNRQFILGGINLLKAGDESKRVDFIKNFYTYTKENDDNFKTTWSQWIKKNNIPPYTLQDELPKK